jgi:nitrite reductase/ring-hydroxylating ferredoxin subunit
LPSPRGGSFKGPAWSFLCLAAEIPNAGDYVATTIGETAVVVTRDTDGGVNAFANRCAHRRFRDHAQRDAYLHTFVADYIRTACDASIISHPPNSSLNSRHTT